MNINYRMWNRIGKAISLGAFSLVFLELTDINELLFLLHHELERHGGLWQPLTEWAAASVFWYGFCASVRWAIKKNGPEG